MARPTGTPTWIDLSSDDRGSTHDFYRELFGWTFTDTGEESHHYEMVDNAGASVCGYMGTEGMTCPDGGPIPSEWDVYLAVDDLDARLARAAARGVTPLFPPVRMPGLGAFAVLVDPTGAKVGMWESLGFDGYEFTGAPGSPVWFELMSTDFDASVDFYRDVFDFDVAMMPVGPEAGPDFRYATNGAGERACAGICNARPVLPEGADSYWRVYFAVESADPAAERIVELGGQVLDGPMDSPFGRFATVGDPQGAQFQINAGPEACPMEGEPGNGA